jgi:hypothetical protein
MGWLPTVMQQLGLKFTRTYRNVCGFESKSIPTHGIVENVEVFLKEYPEKVIHIDIVIVDVPDVWGMLLSRKFPSNSGGTLEVDLTYVNLPLKNGIIGRLPNVLVIGTHVQETNHPVKNNKAHEQVMEDSPKYSPKDVPFAKKEDQIQWPTKEIYLQLLDKYKDREVRTVKLQKIGEEDILIQPSRQEFFTAKSHPPPSAQYSRVVQGMTNFKIRYYKEGGVVWMWDTNKGEPTNVKGSTQFCLGPFKIGTKSVNDSYYMSTLEG